MISRLRLVPVVVVLLVVVMAGRPAVAAGSPAWRAPFQEGLAVLWSWLGDRLPFDGSTAPDQGWHMDPNGSTAPDQGSYIDPDG